MKSITERLALLPSLRTQSKLFDALSEIRFDDNITQVPPDPFLLGLLAHKSSRIRNEAIQVLKKCPFVEAEEALLARAAENDDEYELTSINSTLGKIGTHRSWQHLQQVITHRTNDVACSAIWALADIGDAQHIPVFLEALASNRSVVKWYAMGAIEKWGDDSCIDPVLRRVKKILGRKRKIESSRSELVSGICFLARYRTDYNDIEAFFSTYLPKRTHRLFEAEKRELAAVL